MGAVLCSTMQVKCKYTPALQRQQSLLWTLKLLQRPDPSDPRPLSPPLLEAIA